MTTTLPLDALRSRAATAPDVLLTLPSPLRSSRKGAGSPQQALGIHVKDFLHENILDLNFWAQMLRHDAVADFLKDTLTAKAQADSEIARCIATCAPTVSAAEAQFHALSPPSRLAFRSKAARDMQKEKGAPLARQAEVVAKGTPKRSHKLIDGSLSTYFVASAPAHTNRAEGVLPQWARPLVCNFGSDDEHEVASESGTPAKCLRGSDGCRVVAPSISPLTKPMPAVSAARSALSPFVVNSVAQHVGFLAPLPLHVEACIAGFLSFTQTLLLACVARGAQAACKLPASWEPLVLDRSECRAVLRRLRCFDPLSGAEPASYPLPSALLQATEVRIDLMDPDHRGNDELALPSFSSLEEARRAIATSSCTCMVLDPLEELCRRLRRGWLCTAVQLEVSNIEDHRFDYHFLDLRSNLLQEYPQVRAVAAGGRYTVTARRGPAAAAASAFACRYDPAAVAAMSRERTPPEAPLLLQPAKQICEEEAAFLEENRQAFKSGDAFHFAHAPWRSCTGERVRSCYRALAAKHRPPTGANK